MRCFTFCVNKDTGVGELTVGIQTELKDNGDRVISLGSEGKWCRNQLVYIDKKDAKTDRRSIPLIDRDGITYLGYPFTERIRSVNPTTGRSTLDITVYLKRAFRSRTKALLRINTETNNAYSVNGGWDENSGWPKQVVRAHGYTFGQEWCDDLITMDHLDIILITPAGARKSEKFIVRNYNGEISCIPEYDYNRILADHENEMALLKKESEAVITNSPGKELVRVVSDDNSQKLGKTKVKSFKDLSKVYETPQVERDTVIHIESGETIGV